MHERGAAAGDDALIDRGARGRHGVLDAVLLLLEFDLGVSADLDDDDTAGKLGETLLELLAIPVGVRALDLLADLRDAVGHGLLVAAAVDDRGVVLGDDHAASVSEHLEAHLVELEPDLGGDHLGAREDRDVLEDRLATVAEGRGLDGARGEGAADAVDDERRQGLALDVLGDDEQRLAGLRCLLEDRQELRDARDLALDEQDSGVLEHGLHALGIGDEVGRDVALVELHALGELQAHLGDAGLLDGDDTVLADLVKGIGDEGADLGVLRGDGGDLGDLVAALHLTCRRGERLAHGGDGCVDALLERHRIGARSDLAQALLDHGLREHGGRGGAVAGDVIGLGGDLLDELSSEVLVGVLELDLAGDGHAVVGDGGRAPLLVDDHVAAARAEGHLHGVGELVDAALEAAAGGLVELEDLGHGGSFYFLRRLCAKVCVRSDRANVWGPRARRVGEIH